MLKILEFDCGLGVMLDSTVGLGELHPLERPLATPMKARSRLESFAKGRLAARVALEKTGVFGFPVLKGTLGMPLWPVGRLGSISHDRNWAVAVVASARQGLLSVGVDLAVLGRKLDPQVASKILMPEELEHFCPDGPQMNKEAMMVFCIKESLFKCFNPLAGVYLGFGDAIIETLGAGRFVAWLLRHPVTGKTGVRIRVEGDLLEMEGKLLSLVCLKAGDL